MEVEEQHFVVPEFISGWKDNGGKKPPVVQQLIAWHRANRSDELEFGIILRSAGILKQIMKYEAERQERRRAGGKPTPRIFDIVPVPGISPHMRLSPKRIKEGRGRYRIEYGHMHGTFMLRLTDNLKIFLITWGISEKESQEMAIGPQKAFDLLYERLEYKARRVQKTVPSKGIWAPGYQQYSKHKIDIETSLRFTNHPIFASLEADMLDFFKNIEWWTRHKQPGMRKVLLVGPPGTGKTSINMALAAKYQAEMPVMYCEHTSQVVALCEELEKKPRRVLIIAEELDMFSKPKGEDLNWLDGADTPRNPAGTYLISTTNYPRSIDERILKRPGRIDSIIRVGSLRSAAAAMIARGFIDDPSLEPEMKAIGRALDRTTPAEIREIVSLAIRSLQPGEVLTPGTIAVARAKLKETLRVADDMGDESPDSREKLHQQLGGIDDWMTEPDE